MEQKLGRVPVMILTAAAAAAAYALRLHQLHTAFDASGLAVAGAGNCFFTYFTVAMVLLFAVYAFYLRKRRKYAACCSRSAGVLAVSLAGALGLVLSSAAMLLSPEAKSDSVVAVGGLLTAACWTAIAVARFQGRKPAAGFPLFPVVFFGVILVLRFRSWNRDPSILDYCYELLALISLMCAAYHQCGFYFDRGQRRAAVFFCLCSLFFSAAALAGARPRELALFGGAMLWTAASLWQLLRPARKRPEESSTAKTK